MLVERPHRSINHKKVRTIEIQQNHYTATIKVNGMKEFIIGTNSAVTLMLSDKQILKQTKIQKETNQYHQKRTNKKQQIITQQQSKRTE